MVWVGVKSVSFKFSNYVCTFMCSVFGWIRCMEVWYYKRMVVCGFSVFICVGGCVMLVGSKRVSSRLYIWSNEYISFIR